MFKIILLSSFSVFLLFFFLKNNTEFISEKDKAIYTITLKTINDFENEYKLQFVGIMKSGDKGLLKTLGLDFSLDKVLTKKEGRQMLIKCANTLLLNINNFENIQSFLAERPFTIKNIELTFYLHKDDKGTLVVEPDISCIYLSQGIITYRIRDAHPPQLLKFAEKETFEEAKRIVQKEIPN